MSENTKVLNDADMEQVSGGDGGGASFYWGDYVCPKCHGKVTSHTINYDGFMRSVKYHCAACDEDFCKDELVEE